MDGIDTALCGLGDDWPAMMLIASHLLLFLLGSSVHGHFVFHILKNACLHLLTFILYSTLCYNHI